MVFTQTHFQYLQRNINYLLGHLLESIKYQKIINLTTYGATSHDKFVKLTTFCFQCVCVHMLVHKGKHSINTYQLLATNFEVSADDFNPRSLKYLYTNHESDTGNQLRHFLWLQCECDLSIGSKKQCIIFCIRIKRVVSSVLVISSGLEILPNL